MEFRSILGLSLLGAHLVACGGNETLNSNENIESEIIENLISSGFPENDIQVLEDGTVMVGNDAVVTLEASREMVLDANDTDSAEEQYRTRNLISSNIRNICIDGRTFSGNLSVGLDRAIANYNRLGLTFQMFRVTSSTQGCNALIRGRVIGGSGGSAGFPSGGRPFSTINIGQGSGANADVAEHVITHELGHCIGFRHSDFFDRSISCGGARQNEGQSNVGAILIPGTPSRAVLRGSIMNSCVPRGTNGEFTSSDVTALRNLY